MASCSNSIAAYSRARYAQDGSRFPSRCAASIFAIPLIPNQFFPSSDRPELLVDLTLPQNASIHATETMAEHFEAVLKDDADVARFSTYVGRGAIRFYLPLDVQLPSDFFGQAVIVAKDVAARDRLKVKLEKVLADEFPAVVTRACSCFQAGPSASWPSLEFWRCLA
jgi:multidrug efflux pump subunit AcrB